MTTPTPFRYDGHGINAADGTRIAKVCIQRLAGDQRGINPEFDRLSNLFAAAPKLLASLKETLEALHNETDGKNEHWVTKRIKQSARAAIAEAEGGQP